MAILPGCGSSDGPPAVNAGAAGTGASAGSGGSAGTGGSAGAGGTAGTGGSAGARLADSGSDATSTCTATDIAGKLACIPGLTVQELTPASGVRLFDLTLDQPVDHNAAGGGPRFKQRLRLRHRDESLPVVLASSGYGLATSATELGTTFGTNTLQVEHRYFAPSIPADPVDWKLLNIKQSAADYHAITIAFKTIYKAKWVNTGGSKGGMTSIYHRRFYAADLDATVAYVAPNVLGLDDRRFVDFLKAVGGDTYASCRENLNTLQKTVLTRRAEITPSMTGTYDSLGSKEIALEHAVIEMPFSFWQYQSPTDMRLGCSAIPAADSAQMVLFNFFSTVSVLRNYSDMGFAGFSPYYYQAATQLGAPGVEDAHLLGLLNHRETYKVSTYAPKGVDIQWDPEAMIDVQNWVKAEGKTIMFIYGEYDPWTAGQFEVGSAVDSYRFVAPGGNHSSNIGRLSATDRAQALSVLQGWLGVPPVAPFGTEPEVDDEPPFRPRL